MPGIREKGGRTCHARIVKSPSSSGTTMNPLFLPSPIRAARSCSLNTTKSRNTIPTRTKSPAKESCSRPMCRRSLQTAIPYGTPPKRRKKQWNSQLARRFVLAIPREIPPEQYADFIRDHYMVCRTLRCIGRSDLSMRWENITGHTKRSCQR